MIELCLPAIIYLMFSLVQILIDLYQGLYNTVIVKIIITFFVTYLLNILCQNNLNIISWIVVFIMFIPYLFMIGVSSFLLYGFGLNETTATDNTSNNNLFTDLYKRSTYDTNNITEDTSGNIYVYDPNYTPYNPVYYKSPYVVIPNPKVVPSKTFQPLPQNHCSSHPPQTQCVKPSPPKPKCASPPAKTQLNTQNKFDVYPQGSSSPAYVS